MLARLRSLARVIFRRSRYEADLDDELEFHIEARASHLAATGVDPDAALATARREFARLEPCKEACRDARGARWIDELFRNGLYTKRSIRRHPGFTAVAVLSLAIGIGANLAVFGVLHRLILEKLPVRDPDELYQITLVVGDRTHYRVPFPMFEVMRDHFDMFRPLFGWGGWQYETLVGTRRQTVQVDGVTGNYFDALGVQPAMGRLLTPGDERAHASDIAVISHAFWQTAFGGDRDVVGRSLTVVDKRYVIVGVAPREFTGTEPAAPPAVYLSLHGYERLSSNALTGAGKLWFDVMGRLPDATAVPAVRSALRETWGRLDEPNRRRFARNKRATLGLEDGSGGYSEARFQFSGAVLVLMALAATVFLIACSNIATLLFVRGAGRTREMSIRLALGAGRAQLIRQWMTECLVISAIGGAVGLALAYWITDVLLLFVGDADRPWLAFHSGPAVVVVCLALTMAAGWLCGLLPALRATRAGAGAAFSRAGGGAAGRRGPVAHMVLAGQVAATLVLVVGGTLFARTLSNLNAVSAGFDRKTVVYALPTFDTTVPPDRRPAVIIDVLDRLKRSPLVAAASIGTPPIVWGRSANGYLARVPNYAFAPDEDNIAYSNVAYSGYFDVLRIPFLAGRDFEESDRPVPPEFSRVVIVNDSLARHYFPGRNPIGERIWWTSITTPLEIIGVVSDIRDKSLRDGRKDEVYFPVTRTGWSALLLRADAGVAPEALEAEIRSTLAAVTTGLSLDVAPLEDAVQQSLGRDRLVARLSAALSALGLLLAAIGLYAAIAHTVTSRSREIGIRIAIGATAGDILRMVLGEGLGVTAAGLAIGVPVALAGSQAVRSLLFGVSPSDPATLAASASMLVAAALLAAWWPARRAARLDPSSTLRCE